MLLKRTRFTGRSSGLLTRSFSFDFKKAEIKWHEMVASSRLEQETRGENGLNKEKFYCLA
jgi:hypothetical protein